MELEVKIGVDTAEKELSKAKGFFMELRGAGHPISRVAAFLAALSLSLSRVLYLSLLLSNIARTQNYTLKLNFSFSCQKLLQGCLAQKSGISVQVL